MSQEHKADVFSAKLTVSYAMRDYLHSKGVYLVGELHKSLNNTDTIRLILEKQRALWYPEKAALSGVIWEYKRRHMYDPENVS